MRRLLEPLLSAVFTCCLTTLAFAHAFLDHATPAVGSTVQGSPSEFSLTFTQNIVAGFSGVSLKAENGNGVPLGKASVSDGNTLHARLGHALKPGTYVVSWHVVSVDTHHTQGSFKFTVTP
ncbi:MAG: copper homeostasis periplasmic binding protein CopC [Methylovirgula sp.]|jgi:methionine-rich copper-binding protein CopC